MARALGIYLALTAAVLVWQLWVHGRWPGVRRFTAGALLWPWWLAERTYARLAQRGKSDG